MPFDPSRLYTALLNTGLQTRDNPLYQVIYQLITATSQLNGNINNFISGGGNQGLTTIRNIISLIPSLDNLDINEFTIPGPIGLTGRDGIIGPPGLDGLDSDQIIIPGPSGINGINGISGPPGLDGLDAEDHLSLLQIINNISSGGSALWTLAASNSPTAQATVDFTGLAGVTDIRVLLTGMTLSSSGEIYLRVSIDNGANYLGASGDYVAISGAGIESNQAQLRFYGATATAARAGEIAITGCNLTAPKVARSNFFSTDSVNLMYIPTANPINAVRVLASIGTMSAGTIYVFTR